VNWAEPLARLGTRSASHAYAVPSASRVSSVSASIASTRQPRENADRIVPRVMRCGP
jgi:hypothetical protein